MNTHVHRVRPVGLFAVILRIATGILVGSSFFGHHVCAQGPREAALRKVIAEKTMIAERLAKDNGMLKEMMGFPETSSCKDIKETFQKDMAAHGAKAPAEMRTYRDLLKFQAAVIGEANQKSEYLKEETQSIKGKLGHADQAHQRHLDRLTAMADQAKQDLVKVTEEFRRERTRLLENNTKLQKQFSREREQMNVEREQADTRLQQCREALVRLHAVLLKHGIDPKEAAATGMEPRTWTDPSGRFSLKAVLVEVKDGKAVLRRANGRIVAVEVAKLSQADRNYLSSLDQ